MKATNMGRWSSLFLPSNHDTLAEAMRDSVTVLGYTLFDPFGLIPGRAYKNAVRLFVSPPDAGWTRVVVGAEDATLPMELSARGGLVLALALDESKAEIELYNDGGRAALEALMPYLRPGYSLEDVRKLLNMPDLQSVDNAKGDDLPLDMLPKDVQAMAGKVNLKAAQSMFSRMTGTAMKRAGQDDSSAEAARMLIAGGGAPDWSSAGGKRLRAIVGCLTIPDNWQTPDFTTLRDAYQVLSRKRRNPNATLYPGDADAIEAIPNALDYTPIYGGKDGS